MDCIVHGVTNSGTGLRDLNFHFHSCIAGRFLPILATGEATPPEEIATVILIILWIVNEFYQWFSNILNIASID